MNEGQVEEWKKELAGIEHDEKAILLTHPIIAVWGTKAETTFSNYIYQHEK